eukprot:216008-Rhodomonas_salina.3
MREIIKSLSRESNALLDAKAAGVVDVDEEHERERPIHEDRPHHNLWRSAIRHRAHASDMDSELTPSREQRRRWKVSDIGVAELLDAPEQLLVHGRYAEDFRKQDIVVLDACFLRQR